LKILTLLQLNHCDIRHLFALNPHSLLHSTLLILIIISSSHPGSIGQLSQGH
jgi:hypothetical protein